MLPMKRILNPVDETEEPPGRRPEYPYPPELSTSNGTTAASVDNNRYIPIFPAPPPAAGVKHAPVPYNFPVPAREDVSMTDVYHPPPSSTGSSYDRAYGSMLVPSKASSSRDIPTTLNPGGSAMREQGDDFVCYGMLPRIDVKLMGDMSEIDKKLALLPLPPPSAFHHTSNIHPTTATEISPYLLPPSAEAGRGGIQRFNVAVQPDPGRIQLVFPSDGLKFGQLRQKDSRDLETLLSSTITTANTIISTSTANAGIDSTSGGEGSSSSSGGNSGSSGLHLEATAPAPLLRRTIAHAKTNSDALVTVGINVYGPRSRRDEVGNMLSERKMWLQTPDWWAGDEGVGIQYDNPHMLRFDRGSRRGGGG